MAGSETDRPRPFPHFATQALHVGQDPEQWNSKAMVVPISLATTFKQEGPGRHSGFEYSRSGNPTRKCLEECVAALEGGKHAVCLSSGLAAVDLVIRLLKSGDHIVSMNDLYGGSNRYMRLMKDFNITTTFVDATEPQNVVDALRENTKLIWIETPTNPMIRLVDLEAVVKSVRKQSKAFIAVDNTFMSPYFQRPLDFGVDVVVHSMTKYMNGHTDVVMGCVVLNDDEMAKRLRYMQNAYGSVPSPFDCYLVNRGLKTLHLRMKEHMKNGLAIARYLESNPRVLKVIYPGVPSHPQHELAKKQMRGFSGMMAIYLHGGGQESHKFLESLKLFSVAESLGGFDSLAELPVVMTHADVPNEQRDKLGIGANLIRLSIGLEDVEDLIADLDQALKAAIP